MDLIFPTKLVQQGTSNHFIHYMLHLLEVSPLCTDVSNVFCKCTRLKIVLLSTEVVIKYTQTHVGKQDTLKIKRSEYNCRVYDKGPDELFDGSK